MAENTSFTLEQLLQFKGDTPIEGFEAFWRRQYEEAINWKCAYTVEDEIWSPVENTRIYRIRFTSTDGFSIGLWIARPEHSTGGILEGQGYGNVATPQTTENPGKTIVMPCIRGLGLSQCKEIPWVVRDHAGYGFDAPERYVLVGGVRDLWISLTIMLDMFPDTADNITYSGGSLGGGMGALCIPWDKRIHYGELNVPTLGGRVMLEYPGTPGDPSETRRTKALESETGMRVLDLCSASAAAQFIRVPTLVTPALCDHNVPPPGQFSVANSIPEEYRILRVREVGHAPATDADKLLEKELEEIRKTVFIPHRKD